MNNRQLPNRLLSASPIASLLALALLVSAFVLSSVVGCGREDAPRSTAEEADEAPGQQEQSPAGPPAEPGADPPAEPEWVPPSTSSAEPAATIDPRVPARLAPIRPEPEPRPSVAAGPSSAAAPESVAPAPRPRTESRAPAASSMRVVESHAAAAVEQRVPQNVSDTFDVGYVWAWTKVRNRGTASNVVHIWKHDGRVRSQKRLRVGRSSGWRTWSRHRVRSRDAGDWVVEVRTDSGDLLDTIRFRVEPDALAEK